MINYFNNPLMSLTQKIFTYFQVNNDLNLYFLNVLFEQPYLFFIKFFQGIYQELDLCNM